MKKRIVLFVGLFVMLLSFSANAQVKSQEVKVLGNCGMCASRIQKAAMSVEGVSQAKWDKNTKMLNVSFDASKTDMDKIEKAVAHVGHDTPNYRADDKVYAELHDCCHYDREPAKEPAKLKEIKE